MEYKPTERCVGKDWIGRSFQGSGIGVIYSRNGKEKISYCQICLEMLNVRSKVADRLYLSDVFSKIVIPPDADK